MWWQCSILQKQHWLVFLLERHFWSVIERQSIENVGKTYTCVHVLDHKTEGFWVILKTLIWAKVNQWLLMLYKASVETYILKHIFSAFQLSGLTLASNLD